MISEGSNVPPISSFSSLYPVVWPDDSPPRIPYRSHVTPNQVFNIEELLNDKSETRLSDLEAPETYGPNPTGYDPDECPSIDSVVPCPQPPPLPEELTSTSPNEDRDD